LNVLEFTFQNCRFNKPPTTYTAVIGAIRRVLVGPDASETWSLDDPWDGEDESGPLPNETGFAAALGAEGTFANQGQADYYTDLVRAAIAQGGKLGDNDISLRWLTMTLAGLEGRFVSIDTMWKRHQEGGSYDDVLEPESPIFGEYGQPPWKELLRPTNWAKQSS
jgi:hypothetical protein